MKKARKGFTLIELLIVIAILGVLTAMMQLSGTGATASAKAASVGSGLRTIRTAANMYVAMNAGKPLSCDEFVAASGDYLDSSIRDSAFTITNSGNSWYALYTFQSNDTTLMQEKIKDIEGVDADSTTGAKMLIYTTSN